MVLKEYKELVATAAGVTTVAQFFAPVLICKKIIQNGNAKGIDPMPFIGGIGISVLFLQYGLILNDKAMIPVNLSGLFLNIAYATLYYVYSTEKTAFLGSLGKVAAAVSVIIGYARWEDQQQVEFRFGLIVTVLLLMLIGAPLFSLREIIEKKSVEGLPFPMIASGTVVSFLWLLYGIIIDNVFMQVQNVVGFLLCVIQLSLFAIYPSSSHVEQDKKKKK